MRLLDSLTGEPMVRDAVPEDIPALHEIHENTGLDYRFPDLSHPLFFVKKVLEVEGEIVGAVALRAEAETYLFLKRGDWADNDEKRLAMKVLQKAMVEEAKDKGLDTLVCWVPEKVNRFFAPDMEALGWAQDRKGWVSWSKQI